MFAIKHGKIMEDGLLLPSDVLRAMIVVGIRVNPDVFMTRKVVMLLEGVDGVVFKSCKLFIASNPIGVAALESPSIFIIILRDIRPIAS